jgi:predicted RNase H-like HicB family nuclease
MEAKILNYKIIIEKEGKKYVAFCPTLGLSDYGKTIDQAIDRIKKLIKFHIESLSQLGYPVPVEKETTTLITSVEIPFSSSIKIAYV